MEERNKEEITEVVLKYGEFFAEVESKAKSYAEDMKRLEDLKRQYSKIAQELAEIRQKWRKEHMTLVSEEFCIELIKKHGFDYESKDKNDYPSPFKLI